MDDDDPRIDGRVRAAALLYLDGRCADAAAELRKYIAARAHEMPDDVRRDLEQIAELFDLAAVRGKAWAAARAGEMSGEFVAAADRAADRTVEEHAAGLAAPRARGKDRPS